MPTPLEGIRVLDWTLFQQGPIAAQMLADMGAEVIKIEPPEGEPARGLLSMLGVEVPFNFYYLNQNRGKKGIVLNLSTERGREVFYRLVEKSDVFVTNYREVAVRKLKLDYETLKQHNPRLIYALSSGYGPKGPDANKMSMDLAGQARGGMLSVTQSEDLVPTPIGSGFADVVGGMMTAYGIMLALFARERLGIGQRVDASLLGGQIEIGRLSLFQYLVTGKVPRASVMKDNKNPVFGFYKAGDGKWFAVAGAQADRFWHQFCRAFGVTEIEKDPRFENQVVRSKNSDILMPMLKKVALTKPRDEWLKLLNEAGIPEAPVNDYIDVAKDPQVLANEYIVDTEHPTFGKIKMPGIPVRLSETPGKVIGVAPELGQHTEEVLTEICGYSWDELAALRDAGVY